MRRELTDQLRASREYGAVDFSFPAHDLDGVTLNASFVVSAVTPDARMGAEDTPAVLADLVREGAVPVAIGDTEWARRESIVESEGSQLVESGLRARKVAYTTAIPGDERRWAMVVATVIGDGNPDSDHTHLVVELFDAVMTTWRWHGLDDS